MKGSWRTTAAGIATGLGALSYIAADYFGGKPIDIQELIGSLISIAIAAGFIASRDNKVSSESAGAK